MEHFSKNKKRKIRNKRYHISSIILKMIVVCIYLCIIDFVKCAHECEAQVYIEAEIDERYKRVGYNTKNTFVLPPAT